MTEASSSESWPCWKIREPVGLGFSVCLFLLFFFFNIPPTWGGDKGDASDPGRAEALEGAEVPAHTSYKPWTPSPVWVCLNHPDRDLDTPHRAKSPVGRGRASQNKGIQSESQRQIQPLGYAGPTHWTTCNLSCRASVRFLRVRQGHWLTLACPSELPRRPRTDTARGQMQQHQSKIQGTTQIAAPKVWVFFFPSSLFSFIFPYFYLSF